MPLPYPELYERFMRTQQGDPKQIEKLRGEFFQLAMSIASQTDGTHEGAQALRSLEEALSWAERGVARFDRDR